MKLNMRHSAPLYTPFPMICCFAGIKISESGRKPWTIVRRFHQISFHPHNSPPEGATKLKFAPFCSSLHSLSDDVLFCWNQIFQILAEIHAWTIVRRFDQISFHPQNSPPEGPTKLKFVPFCSSLHALSDGKPFSYFQILSENHGL